MDCLVSKESAAQIHVVFMGQGLQPEALEQRRLKGDYAKIVAFRPTGELTFNFVLMSASCGYDQLQVPFYWPLADLVAPSVPSVNTGIVLSGGRHHG